MRLQIFTVALMVLISGCLQIPDDQDRNDLSHLQLYEKCDLSSEEDDPGPCIEPAPWATATEGPPPIPWVCLEMHNGLGIWWNPQTDEHALYREIDPDFKPNMTVATLESGGNRYTWVVENAAQKYWWSVGDVVEDDYSWWWRGTAPYVTTNDTTLQNADLEYVWNVHEPNSEGEPLELLNLRFHVDETYYTFSANSPSPYNPDVWGAGSLFIEKPEFYLKLELPLMESGSYTGNAPLGVQNCPV